jgi:hypothetical protein
MEGWNMDSKGNGIKVQVEVKGETGIKETVLRLRLRQG